MLIWRIELRIITHPPYSPDLTPTDRHLSDTRGAKLISFFRREILWIIVTVQAFYYSDVRWSLKLVILTLEAAALKKKNTPTPALPWNFPDSLRDKCERSAGYYENVIQHSGPPVVLRRGPYPMKKFQFQIVHLPRTNAESRAGLPPTPITFHQPGNLP